MSYRWPQDTDFAHLELDVLDRDCPSCGRRMYVCDHRYRRLHTLEGPLQLVCKLNHCPDRDCPGHAKTKGPEIEATIAPPQWTIGWDVFCWLGHRRFGRHWSIPQLRAELQDTYHIRLSDDAIAWGGRRYQTLVAARQQDAALLAAALSRHRLLDPDYRRSCSRRKGTRRSTWCVSCRGNARLVRRRTPGCPAPSAAIRPLLAKAKQWAEQLGKPVALWMSDKQDAFVQGIAAEFPEVLAPLLPESLPA